MQRPERVMMGLAENIQACLRDFQTGTASMDRKRHLASSARGFYCFCHMAQIRVQKVQGVQLSPIRGRKKGRGITGRGCREGETERECGHERFPLVRGKGLPEEDMGCPAPHTYMHLRYGMGEVPLAL